MAQPKLTRNEFAQVFGVTIRTVADWVAEGLPRSTVGKNRYAYGTESLQWAVRKLKARENGAPKSPRYQRDLIKLEKEKLELLEMQREVIPMDLHVARVTAIVERIAMTFRSMPLRFARQLVGAQTIAEARVGIERMREELVQDIRAGVDDDHD